jgi:ATP/maltotriose-dependent transcriptional regulator MalT
MNTWKPKQPASDSLAAYPLCKPVLRTPSLRFCHATPVQGLGLAVAESLSQLQLAAAQSLSSQGYLDAALALLQHREKHYSMQQQQQSSAAAQQAVRHQTLQGLVVGVQLGAARLKGSPLEQGLQQDLGSRLQVRCTCGVSLYCNGGSVSTWRMICRPRVEPAKEHVAHYLKDHVGKCF